MINPQKICTINGDSISTPNILGVHFNKLNVLDNDVLSTCNVETSTLNLSSRSNSNNISTQNLPPFYSQLRSILHVFLMINYRNTFTFTLQYHDTVNTINFNLMPCSGHQYDKTFFLDFSKMIFVRVWIGLRPRPTTITFNNFDYTHLNRAGEHHAYEGIQGASEQD